MAVNPMFEIDILSEAARVVDGNRRNDYGTPLENHKRTAQLWSAYLGRVLLPEDVCMLNILQKISRGMNTITHDTLVDIAGYARNIQIIKQEKAGKNAPNSYTPRENIPANAGARGPIQVEGWDNNAKKVPDMPSVPERVGLPTPREISGI
jgi:hypothetical protein